MPRGRPQESAPANARGRGRPKTSYHARRLCLPAMPGDAHVGRRRPRCVRAPGRESLTPRRDGRDRSDVLFQLQAARSCICASSRGAPPRSLPQLRARRCSASPRRPRGARRLRGLSSQQARGSRGEPRAQRGSRAGVPGRAARSRSWLSPALALAAEVALATSDPQAARPARRPPGYPSSSSASWRAAVCSTTGRSPTTWAYSVSRARAGTPRSRTWSQALAAETYAQSAQIPAGAHAGSPTRALLGRQLRETDRARSGTLVTAAAELLALRGRGSKSRKRGARSRSGALGTRQRRGGAPDELSQGIRERWGRSAARSSDTFRGSSTNAKRRRQG